ncbi:MAG TPA: hypothetical protein VLG76_06220 [Rhabdochlamydiaceae bacterium]|nr:hypothetical protein [Rhabdochlamydiaceae bacterium]
MKLKQKKPFTLLEIMIVILLIGLIGSVIGYSMKGSLDEGRAFKSEQAITQIKDILELEFAKDDALTAQEVQDYPEKYLMRSGLVKNPDKIIKDGWGNRFVISIDESKTISVSSEALVKYKAKKQEITNAKQSKKKG